MNQGNTISFSQMFGELETAQIPVIQRDYAQGREEAWEVRRQFLAALRGSLTTESPSHPLNLDFVYGNFEGDNKKTFSILDGQQRMTTLFLLHWYLAAKEGVLEAFRSTFVAGENARFTYKTRTSASEFFDALAKAENVDPNTLSTTLTEAIVDKSWFMLSWREDPTVHACLNMLDSIHETFFDCPTNSYGRLTDSWSPRITFQFLKLKDFGLSDELYIKMNARGMQLTHFENFKAWLCGHLEHIPGGNELESKLDQQWTDLFWQLSRRTKEATFDQLYLRFFHLMAFYRACDRTEELYIQMDESEQRWLSVVRSMSGHIPSNELEKHESFDQENLRRVELILDYFYGLPQNSGLLDDLLKVLTSNDYVRQARFYALVRFIESMTPEAGEAQEELMRWKRVTNNLINNHRIDEMSSIVPSLQSLNELSDHCAELYEFVADSGIESGFTPAQREEEQLKASLILEDPYWESLFKRFEGHVYLKGKLGFLLDMAREPDDSINSETFEHLATKTASVLSDEIRVSKENLLERALLSLGDYLVYHSFHRSSFCLPNRGTYRERSENWFRVVKKPEFRALLDHIDIHDTEASIRNLIAKCDCGGWRQLVVENPQAIGYCTKRLIHREGDHVCLLSKASFKGFHAELRTYVLDLKLKQWQQEKGLPESIRSVAFKPVYGSNEWSYNLIKMQDGGVYAIYYDYEGFTTQFRQEPKDGWVDVSMPSFLEEMIQECLPGSPVR